MVLLSVDNGVFPITKKKQGMVADVGEVEVELLYDLIGL